MKKSFSKGVNQLKNHKVQKETDRLREKLSPKRQ